MQVLSVLYLIVTRQRCNSWYMYTVSGKRTYSLPWINLTNLSVRYTIYTV